MYTIEQDVTVSSQCLHSNWDCCALSKAALCNNGGPLVTTADSMLPSRRIPSVTVTSPVMWAVRATLEYVGRATLAMTTSACLRRQEQNPEHRIFERTRTTALQAEQKPSAAGAVSYGGFYT